MSEKRLLIAHSDPAVAADLKGRLRELGFIVAAVADSWDQALELAGSIRPDLVLVEECLGGGDRTDETTPLLRISTSPATPRARISDDHASEPWELLQLPCSDRELRLTTEFALRHHSVNQSLVHSRDLLEQKITELESSERRYRTLVETPTLGFVLMDRRGRYLYVSPKIEELTGYPPDAFYKDWRLGWRITHEDDHPIGERAFVQARNGTAALDQEFRLIAEDGSLSWTSASTFPVRDVDGKVTAVQVIMFDISERKQLEEELRESQKMQALGQLTAGIAHNFNNMLAVVIGNLELAVMDLPTSLHGQLKVAENSARRAAEMVSQLMLFSRYGRAPTVDQVGIDTVISNTIKICLETFDRKIDMPVRMPDQLDPVRGNQNQLEQVLLNLCLNARDALENVAEPYIAIDVEQVDLLPGSRTMHPDATPGRYLRISVRDDGVGMDENTRLRVFEPFFTTKDVDRGTGLGLSTAFGIARQHKGWIDCESTSGSGSTFYLYLPAAEKEAVVVDETGSPDLLFGSGTILLIDDEEPIRITMTAMLRRLGYDVLVSAGGREGVELFERERQNIDLVLLDLLMPEMSGAEVLAELRQIDQHAKVALFTGHDSGQEERAGVAGVIRKPVRLEDLAQSLHWMLSAAK